VVIAALYVLTDGPYFGLPDVDPWDKDRDARLYAGPYPVVAHPPCGQWGVFARQGWTHRPLGDDDGCFAAALASVRQWGGVLEHPACSSAWKAHELIQPPLHGGWVYAGDGGWTCTVDQGHYGHQCRKPTWLYAHHATLPSLTWGPSRPGRDYNNLSTRQRTLTPLPFRDLLLGIARTVRREEKAA
jgi:hypothetical protein